MKTDEQKRLLGIRAATVFPELFKDAWKHDWSDTCKNSMTKCTKCGKGWYTYVQYNSVCTVPTIDINDWNVAMMLVRARAVKPVVYNLRLLFKAKTSRHSEYMFILWLIYHATLADYIEAACIAKENA